MPSPLLMNMFSTAAGLLSASVPSGGNEVAVAQLALVFVVVRRRVREERAGGRRVDQRGIAERRKVGAEEPLVDQVGELRGGAADGQVAQRLALVGGVGRVAVDHVAGQHLHVAGHVAGSRPALRIVFRSLKSAALTVPSAADAAEDLDHVVAG